MPTARYRGPPMTLANMRANGVRSLCVTCEICHHEAVMNVDAFDNATPVPAFGPRMVCTSCGIIGAYAELEGTIARRELDRRAVAPKALACDCPARHFHRHVVAYQSIDIR
jgi:hypothetical protein